MIVNWVNRLLEGLIRLDANLSRDEWLAIFAVLLVIGFFLMRGFGSRTSY